MQGRCFTGALHDAAPGITFGSERRLGRPEDRRASAARSEDFPCRVCRGRRHPASGHRSRQVGAVQRIVVRCRGRASLVVLIEGRTAGPDPGLTRPMFLPSCLPDGGAGGRFTIAGERPGPAQHAARAAGCAPAGPGCAAGDGAQRRSGRSGCQPLVPSPFLLLLMFSHRREIVPQPLKHDDAKENGLRLLPNLFSSKIRFKTNCIKIRSRDGIFLSDAFSPYT